MTTREELESLSTDELHERAMHTARHRADVRFFWRLIEAIPTAEAAAGHDGSARADIASMTSLVSDLLRADEGDLGEALRPLYIDYLEKHG